MSRHSALQSKSGPTLILMLHLLHVFQYEHDLLMFNVGGWLLCLSLSCLTTHRILFSSSFNDIVQSCSYFFSVSDKLCADIIVILNCMVDSM